MSYVKTQWVNNTTPINDTNLNKIEKGIYDNSLVVDAVTKKLNPTDTETYKTAELTEGQITDVIGVSDIVIKGQTSQNGTPTPSAPVDVNVVSGSNVISTSNINLLAYPYQDTTKTLNGITWTDNGDGTITANGTATANSSFSLLGKLSNQKKILAQYISGGYSTSAYIRAYNNTSGTYTELGTSKNSTSVGALNLTTHTVGYIEIFIVNGTTVNNVKFKPMLLKTNVLPTYKPYQGKELHLDLGSIELCKIGNYQDYFYKSGSKWYLHKEIGKVVLDGSENWSGLTDLGNCIRVNTSFRCKYQQQQLSDYFKYNTAYTLDEEHFYNYDNQFYVFLLKTRATTMEEFKTWVSNHNITIYYVLETATNTEITDTTLISQLNAIINSPLYEDTNITQTNSDLSMVLDITACKDNINGIKAFIRK